MFMRRDRTHTAKAVCDSIQVERQHRRGISTEGGVFMCTRCKLILSKEKYLRGTILGKCVCTECVVVEGKPC